MRSTDAGQLVLAVCALEQTMLTNIVVQQMDSVCAA